MNHSDLNELTDKAKTYFPSEERLPGIKPHKESHIETQASGTRKMAVVNMNEFLPTKDFYKTYATNANWRVNLNRS